MRSRARRAIATFAVVVFGCSLEPPLELAVTFPGPLEIEADAPVRYQGVPVGEVAAVSLSQTAPNQPALVVLSLSITDHGITLREGDVFEVVSDGLLGDEYVRVTPGREPSQPLESGALVAGRAPFLTRVLESADETLGSLGDLARETRDEWVEALREAAEAAEPEEDR